MYYIKDAKLRRMTEYDGERCAEIGVLPGAVDDPGLLVYFTQRSPGEYEMVRIIRNDADALLDWYDNNMHDAFVDVTDEAFEASSLLSADQVRDKFKMDLLAFGSVETDMQIRFLE